MHLRQKRQVDGPSFLPRPQLISGQLDMEDLDIDMSLTAEELTEAAAG